MDTKSKRKVLAAKAKSEHRKTLDKKATPKRNGRTSEKQLMPDLVAGELLARLKKIFAYPLRCLLPEAF